MLLFWPELVIALAGTGLESASEREYLLSLPFTRRRIVLTRLAVVLGQIAALTVLPSPVVCALALLVGQRYPVGDALMHSLILLVGGVGLFGLTMFLRLITTDAAAYTAAGALVVLCVLFTFVAQNFTHTASRVMNGAEYFFDHRVPWTGFHAQRRPGIRADLAVDTRGRPARLLMRPCIHVRSLSLGHEDNIRGDVAPHDRPSFLIGRRAESEDPFVGEPRQWHRRSSGNRLPPDIHPAVACDEVQQTLTVA